ncbi:Gfo/Idh/MocA family protein [Schlesneria sp. T3-172]|uniref:Gfo/Idh/MocA family protein n=1 Tax=Schlesneria sphaerica TaxID=3373610 RepID=UPI0037C88C3E
MQSQSRRTFLRGTSAIVASSLLASGRGSIARAAQGKRVRVGIIGATGKGDYGHGVDVAFTKLPHVEIVALADADPAGREKASKRTNPAKTFADYHEMLEKVPMDVVAICPRWIDQHHDMLVAAAEAGCHVYMEKPFCPTLAECDSAVEALKKKNLKLGIAHVSQYSPVLGVVQSLIKNGEIGDVLELRARGKEDQRGGGEDLWVLGSHMLGLMRSLAGENATSCSATVLKEGHKVTKSDVVAGAEGIGPLAGDNIQATYTFPGGVFGHFASRKGMGLNPSRFAIQVFGSKGIIEMESGYLAKAQILRDPSWSPGRSGKSWEPVTSAGIGKPETRTDGSYEGGHLAAINDLLDCIEHDKETLCSAEDSRQITEMIVSVFESHRLGRPVDLPVRTRVNPLTLLT